MDEERRRLERAAEAGDVEALVRQAIACGRSGELARAGEVLALALRLEPAHAVAGALAILVDVGLGQTARGLLGHLKRKGADADLGSFLCRLEPQSLEALATAALEPAPGAVDGELVATVVGAGRTGVECLVRALARVGGDGLEIVVLHVGEIAAGIERTRVPEPLVARVLEGLEAPSPTKLADWALLAGALKLREARAQLEQLLDSDGEALRRVGARALEMLADEASRQALESALARTKRKGERVPIERALAALPAPSRER